MSVSIMSVSEKDLRHLKMLIAELDAWNNKELNLSSLSSNLDSLISTLRESDFYPSLRKEWEVIEEINAVELDSNSPKSDSSQLLVGAVGRLRQIVVKILEKK